MSVLSQDSCKWHANMMALVQALSKIISIQECTCFHWFSKAVGFCGFLDCGTTQK